MIDPLIMLGMCQRPEHQPEDGMPSLWDPQGERGMGRQSFRDVTRKRHHRARLLCLRCPLLDACERYLSDMENKMVPVAGIVAGRYFDGPPQGGRIKPKPLDKERQVTCRGCGHLMWPRSNILQDHPAIPGPDECQHKGEGLCESCWPKLSREARRHAA